MSRVTVSNFYVGDDFDSLRRAVEAIQQFSTEIDTVNVTEAYQVLTEDDLVLVTSGGSDFAITLPFVDDAQRKSYVFKKVDASADTTTIQGSTGETIDGTTKTLTSQYQVVRLIPQRETGIGTEIRGWHLV